MQNIPPVLPSNSSWTIAGPVSCPCHLAIEIHLSDEIPLAEIEFAESLLMLFWRLTEKYYGMHNMAEHYLLFWYIWR